MSISMPQSRLTGNLAMEHHRVWQSSFGGAPGETLEQRSLFFWALPWY
jgi:hypothetical protein